ncbi:HBS1-like protein isoform X3 [Podarcis raffonei]|uniref:HBS1-like protein isoform X3 n=1 Tax=Podarcis raffonei TaxID=65483 RepID=UPI0023292B51|nr:HBS1-like protein isoform X3 [Podarcis raffonei]
MARHRNVRGYNYDEDFEEDDLYGQSVEDDFCISPSTAAQFIYSRRDNPTAYAETLEEKYDYEAEHSNDCIPSHQLTGAEKAKLDLCLDRMREVLEKSVPEKVMVEAVLNSKFDVQQALDSVLAQDNKQNKIKNEDAIIAGKATKGLFCSEIFSSTNNLTNSIENTLDTTKSCCSLSNPVVNFESCNASAPGDKTVFRPKYVKTPSVKKKKSVCNSSGALPIPFSDNDKSHYKPLNKQVTHPPTDSTSTSWKSCNESDACFSSEAELLKENSSENVSWNPSEYKGVDLMGLVRLNETGDSADAQDSALIFLQKNYDSKSCLDNPPGFINAFGNLMLDSKRSYQLSKKAELSGNAPSFSHSKGSFQGHISTSSEANSLTFSVSQSPSLADLLQEHQGSNSNKPQSLSDLCNPSAGFTDLELGLSPLSQLANQPQISPGMTELSGSLSSLTFSKSSPVKELESLSLSDLIAKSTALDKPRTTSSCSELRIPKTVQPTVVNSDIDLSVLIRKSTLSPQHVHVQSGTSLPEKDALFSKQGRQMFVAKGRKKNQKKTRSHILEGTVSWAKALSATPSAFAITLCLHYPPKRCKRQTVNLHKAFLYSRQMQEVKINETGPLLAITPFDFKSPSPDDIVKLGQKKAFTR